MKRLEIKKILFVTLSNIGDCILTLPVLDALIGAFPGAGITVLLGPRPAQIFEGNPLFKKVIIYDKHAPLREKIRLFNQLKKENFDLVVDLRNSFFGAFLPARMRTSALLAVLPQIKHMQERHFFKIQNLKFKIPAVREKKSLFISPQDEDYINRIFRENKICAQDKIIVIAAGARSHIKRWGKEKFVELISSLGKEFAVRIILVGDKSEVSIARYISENSAYPVIDLAGETTISQLASLLKRAELLITNDSATLHLASYLDLPVVAIFGPTDELKYGPWSRDKAIVRRDIYCRPCQKAQCKFGTLECLSLIRTEEVLQEARRLLAQQPLPETGKENFQRILIVRTDRIGDVLLSTPVIKALRQAYPWAYIAMIVAPLSKDIVEGNPYLDKVIIYDKDGKQKSWRRSIKFAQNLKKKKFDLALILHPTNRVHLITFFAAIPRRVGYDRKFGFLLTDKIKHTKQLGEKHELEYNLDLLAHLGIKASDKSLFMPIRPESETAIEDLLRREGVEADERLLAIHPGASCPSKIWPNTRFATLADRLAEKYGLKVLILSGAKDSKLAQKVVEEMRYPAINLAGKITLSQLASVIKRCRLFISNDSGPVHMAAALGTPVVSIFGRSQKGLSPQRWAPLGKDSRYLHKNVGCIECLAHNCRKQFACLAAISVEDVAAAAAEII